jgi:hypothetical protein
MMARRLKLASFASVICFAATLSLAREFWIPSGWNSGAFPSVPPHVLRIDSDSGQFLGNGAGFYETFFDLTWGPNNLIYATGNGSGAGKVVRFRADGTLLDAIVPEGWTHGQYVYGTSDDTPSRVAIGGDGFLYVSSFTSNNSSYITGLLKYNAQTGVYVGPVSGYGSGVITDVERDSLGRLYVASTTGIRRYDFGTNAWTPLITGATGAIEFSPESGAARRILR